MSKRWIGIALTVLLSTVAVGCGKKEGGGTGGAASPDAAIRRSAELLKQGDIAGLMQNALPPKEFERVKAEWGKDADQKPITDEDRRKFQETMTRLTEPGADQKIYAEIEPQLKQFDAQYQQQMPMYVAMGSGWLQGMVQQNKNLSDEEKQQATAAINAIAAWVQKTRFTDPDAVKKVLAIATQGARDLNLKTLDEARSLGFDQSMQKAHVAFDALKKALDVYGFSIDETLDSIKPEVVSSDGTTAKVKISYVLLGTPLVADAEMVNVDGRWYGKQTIENLKKPEPPAGAPKVSGSPEATPDSTDPATTEH